MINVSPKQALERWDVLPENLKEAMFSERNADILWQICEAQHLSENKIHMISTIVGDVILGFIGAEDITLEIQDRITLDQRIIQIIAREINQRILPPLREEINKIYSPLTAIPETKPVTDLYRKEEKKETEPKSVGIGSEIPPKPIEIIQPPKPAEITPPSLLVETPAPLAKTNAETKAFKSAMPPEPISADKPFMIHQETETQSVAEKNKSMPTIGWFRKASPAAGQEKSKTPEPTVKVQLETFGPKIEEKKESKEPIVAKTEIPKQKVVHYREVETPATFGRPGAQPQPPREVQPPKPGIPATKPFGATTQDKPFDTAQGKPFNAPQQTQSKPFGFAQNKSEPPKPFSGIAQSKPFGPNQQQGKSSNITQDKPLDTIQSRPEPAKPEQPVKPTEPKVINLESFLGEPKENQPKDEIELEGNIINLKNNNKSGS